MVGREARQAGLQLGIGAVLASLMPVVSACGDETCERQPVYVPALFIQVVDADSGDPVCDAQVEIERAGAVERLTPNCRYRGGSKPGEYQVRVSREGYLDAQADVSVSGDECAYAESKEVVVELSPVS